MDLSRAEMIELVEKIRRAEGTGAEIHANVALFDANCRNPNKNSLIFWPHGVPHDSSKAEPTAEEIVDKAMMPGRVIHL